MRFWELRVPGTPETAEGLTNFLWELGALGVVEEIRAAERPGAASAVSEATGLEEELGSVELRAFFPEAASSTHLAQALGDYRDALRELGLPVAEREPEVRTVLEEAWASAWQTSFPPRAVGDRLVVLPPWADGSACEGTPERARLRVVIEPGRAFGTGHHGSTEGCLVLLEHALAVGLPGGKVLDLGAGSGILAIAAVALGAPEVVAVDVDPDAVRAIADNAARNGCSARIRAVLGGPEVLPNGTAFDLVLANLLGSTHLSLRGEYRRRLTPAGTLVLGGMLADDDEAVREAFRADGFAEAERVVVDGWSSLRLRLVAGTAR
jgi:ribosomal protein L11 methyltransferase